MISNMKPSGVALPAGPPIAKCFVWLFAALVMMALLSPPGSSQDEWYHASSIWCAQGERDPYCTEKVGERGSNPSARTNITFINCQKSPDVALWCPQEESASLLPTNGGLYPGLFYFTLSWLVVPSVEVSVLIARVANSLLLVVVLAVTASLLPHRNRTVLFLLILGVFSPTGYFLFASINPSSWTSLGIGVGWLAWYSAGESGPIAMQRRLQLAFIGTLAGVLAVGSRWDATPFLVFAAVLVGSRLIWARFPRNRRWLLLLTPLAVIGSFLLLSSFVLSPRRYLKAIVTYSDGETDNMTFFSHYILYGLPNMLRALGTVPTMSSVILPSLVYIGGLLILVVLVVKTYNSSSKAQQFGTAVIILVATSVIMAQAATVDQRDLYGIEPRYVYPLLLLAAGWWFSLGPADLLARVTPYLKWVVNILTATFALSAFTIAERFVDRQSYALRLIPDGSDQWWWSWMPVGPNVVVLLSVLFMWRFLDLVRRSLIESSTSVDR